MHRRALALAMVVAAPAACSSFTAATSDPEPTDAGASPIDAPGPSVDAGLDAVAPPDEETFGCLAGDVLVGTTGAVTDQPDAIVAGAVDAYGFVRSGAKITARCAWIHVAEAVDAGPVFVGVYTSGGGGPKDLIAIAATVERSPGWHAAILDRPVLLEDNKTYWLGTGIPVGSSTSLTAMVGVTCPAGQLKGKTHYSAIVESIKSPFETTTSGDTCGLRVYLSR